MPLRPFAFLLVAAVLALAAPVPAQAAASCGERYTIQRGDTLSEIAAEALGDPGRWTEIYEYGSNARVIGETPHLIRIGDRIALPPCPSTVPDEVPEMGERRTPEDASGANLPIELVTAGGYAPLTDESWPEKGMMTHVVRAAFRQSDLPNPIEIDFINDWGAHLTTLLAKHKYDFGFPWFKPDCTDPSALPESMRIRCDYAWSDPLYPVSIVLYYAPDDLDIRPTSFEDLKETRICRPAGYFTFDLAERGLRDDDTAQTVELIRPATVAQCVEAVARGNADFLSLNRFTVERELAETGMDGLIRPVETLVYPLELHLVAHSDNVQAARSWMSAFNDGLRRLRRSGQYDKITTFHLRRHRDTTE